MGALTKTSNAGMVLRPSNFAELAQFAQMAAKSAMVPAQYKGQPENIMLAIQMGSELGLAPMQALQNIAVVNGRPAVWGDAMPGLCRQSAVCDDIVETITGDGDKMVATCTAIRVGKQPVVRTFSVEDAKKAGLWGKTGPWQQYPKRMLQMRARGFALRDAFPDVLRGLISAEEAADTPPDTFAGTTIEAKAETPTPREEARRPTVTEWLKQLDADLAQATTPEDIDMILAREDVHKAQDSFHNGAKERLDKLIADAVAHARAMETSAPGGFDNAPENEAA